MKVNAQEVANVLLMVAIVVVLVGSTGCLFYPKAERVSGELVSDVSYEIVDETTVIEADGNGRQWIYVDCDYWAGCFMRCDGASSQCKQLAKDSKFSILSIFMNVFN